MGEFSKKYQPETFESFIYNQWETSGAFLPKKYPFFTGKTFYIPLPPPNITGVLHLGHALTITLEDIMVRYHRMKGDETLWIPGTDHAGISTQVRVEKMLAEKNIKRQDLGREGFLQEVWKWKEQYGNTITKQIRIMGASVDWTKEQFTLSETLSSIVKQAFVTLYERGMIYKGKYMVHYSPALQTVISDQEVVYKEEKGKLYYIAYFIEGAEGEIVVATTRPETLFGDVAVAVHPKDKRYKKFLKNKKRVILPIVNIPIPIIADEAVDCDFGTGAVKITPAHDFQDFEIALRHNLPLDRVVIDKNGIMTKRASIFAGMDSDTARKNVVELLKAKGNLLKEEEYVHRVGYCERSGCRVEPIISEQWFVNVAPMAKKVMEGYKKGDFEIIPSRFEKVFEDWMHALRDWCISRQLWWGHRIPVYYEKNTGNIVVTTEDLSRDPSYVQDEDVLDTWFSSALRPFSILGYDIRGEETSELFETFYPADVLETGYDILFFWVIRMLLFGYEFTGKTPFKKIYLHGIVRDAQGRKMSKSLGNGVDPLDMVSKYGTDALRLTLSIGNTPGNDLKFDEKNVYENKMFLNKLWNASRFVYYELFQESTYEQKPVSHIQHTLLENYKSLLFHEKRILSRIEAITTLFHKGMNDFQFSLVGMDICYFVKHEFCDYFIEEYKVTRKESQYGKDVLYYVLINILQCLHPFVPFVTEAIWQKFHAGSFLMESPYVQVQGFFNSSLEKEKEVFIEVIKEVRNIRSVYEIPPSACIDLALKVKKEYSLLFEDTTNRNIMISLLKVARLEFFSGKKIPSSYQEGIYGITKSGVELYVLYHFEKSDIQEREYLLREIEDVKEYLLILDKKLLNENFMKHAPADLVKKEMEKKMGALERLEKLEEKLKKVEQRLNCSGK